MRIFSLTKMQIFVTIPTLLWRIISIHTKAPETRAGDHFMLSFMKGFIPR